jgi:hypothetical protein
MQNFFNQATMQDHPLRILQDFVADELANEAAKRYDDLRFVGYVLEIGYDTVTLITSDPFKVHVGGVPRNSVLIMLPSLAIDGMPPHFTVLRVLEAAPTPLSREVQQTYFELQKKSMPELDVFTQSELQWGALKASVLGMFYPHPTQLNTVEFSGDLNNFVSAHNYRVFSPNQALLDLITNTLVPNEHRFEIGRLRFTESRLVLPATLPIDVAVNVSTVDFMGARTAMFGKTRLGKSNVVKLIAQSLIETTSESRNVGQIIFDINGEYANDNLQDGSSSLASAHPDRCVVYALTPKPSTPSRPLKLNFYEHPDRAHRVLADLLAVAGRNSIYIKNFCSAGVPSVEDVNALPPGGDKIRAHRRLLIYWAILAKAGYAAPRPLPLRSLDPGFAAPLRSQLYRPGAAPQITSLNELQVEMEKVQDFARANSGSALLTSSGSGDPLFDSDDKALLEFLKPSAGTGARMLQPFRGYHDPNAGNFVREVIDLVDSGHTVVLDLGNANPEVMNYFSQELSSEVFQHQVTKFADNTLGDHFVQLYFEEAHNLFPSDDKSAIDIYQRLAKEGAKYHIGMVYATQSVTSINRDLLAQTENFFVAHLSSVDQVNALARVNIEFDSLKDDIMRAKTPGFIRMLTKSHRFVVSLQANRFSAAPPVGVAAAAPSGRAG